MSLTSARICLNGLYSTKIAQEKEASQVRIEELLEENSRLLLCNRSQADESSFMLVELNRLRHGSGAYIYPS
jgi:hypothetical protein